MTLTLYSAHILVLAVGVLEDWDTGLYLFRVVSSLVFADIWRRRHDQGPLEKLVAEVSTPVQRAVLAAGREPAMPAGSG
jgi:uncharacterized membrane protein YeiB